ncbi:MAG: MarR family winged helix-turn-helix transcriptional regulator [Gaiellales bacterium]
MTARTITKTELASEVGGLIMRLAKQAKRSLRAKVEQIGLTVPQAIALRLLAEAGGRETLGELGRNCDMLPSTLTGVVDRLEQHELVQRERDATDRRLVWIQLTERGAALQQQLPRWEEEIGRTLSALTGAELEMLRTAFARAVDDADRGGR